MSITYTTKSGERLADIVTRYYGSTNNRTVEKVLEDNRGLADQDIILPMGYVITLPVITDPNKSEGMRLWT